jgi:hypothetical protein
MGATTQVGNLLAAEGENLFPSLCLVVLRSIYLGRWRCVVPVGNSNSEWYRVCPRTLIRVANDVGWYRKRPIFPGGSKG